METSEDAADLGNTWKLLQVPLSVIEKSEKEDRDEKEDIDDEYWNITMTNIGTFPCLGMGGGNSVNGRGHHQRGRWKYRFGIGFVEERWEREGKRGEKKGKWAMSFIKCLFHARC